MTTEPSNLIALEARWKEDKTSRVFLQLAEELRRTDRQAEALAVLDEGLQHHPASLAARVARGRCLVALNRHPEALEELHRVLAKDPQQLVAHRLLVDAHRNVGDLEAAAKHLEIYASLNPSDPDLEKLAEDIESGTTHSPKVDEVVALGTDPEVIPSPAEAEPRPQEQEESPVVSNARPRHVDLGDSLFPAVSDRRDQGRLVKAINAEGWFSFQVPEGEPEEEPESASAVATEAPAPEEESGGGREQVFALGATPPYQEAPDLFSLLAEPPAAAEPVAEVGQNATDEETILVPEVEIPPAKPILDDLEDAEAVEAEASEPHVADPAVEPSALPDAEAERVAESPSPDVSSDAAPVAAGAALTATVTLGQLYLRQGHVRDAREAFLEVLSGDPSNADALAGLAAAENTPERLVEAADLLEGWDPDVHGEGLTAKKTYLLEEYRRRVSGGRGDHVH